MVNIWFIIIWLVVKQPSWKIWKSMGRMFPYMMENKKCSKPPTSHIFKQSRTQDLKWSNNKRREILSKQISCQNTSNHMGCYSQSFQTSMAKLRNHQKQSTAFDRQNMPGFIIQCHWPSLFNIPRHPRTPSTELTGRNGANRSWASDPWGLCGKANWGLPLAVTRWDKWLSECRQKTPIVINCPLLW